MNDQIRNDKGAWLYSRADSPPRPIQRSIGPSARLATVRRSEVNNKHGSCVCNIFSESQLNAPQHHWNQTETVPQMCSGPAEQVRASDIAGSYALVALYSLVRFPGQHVSYNSRTFVRWRKQKQIVVIATLRFWRTTSTEFCVFFLLEGKSWEIS